MGTVRPVPRVRPLFGLLVSDRDDLAAVHMRLCAWLGPVAQASEPVAFTYSDYYASEMGEGLWRQYLVFSDLRPPEALAEWKLTANELERSWGLNARGGRRVNLDPGYLTEAKVVLATTKDFPHRIYIGRSIYAESTLHYHKEIRSFQSVGHTYPDFRTAYCLKLFNQARKTLRSRLR